MIVFHECPGLDRQIILDATRGGFFMKANTLLALAASMALAAPVAEARITKVVIDPALSQSPTFGGYAWPGVGQYERLIGTAYGEVNPSDRRNSVIVDVELAPRNASGNVEYSFDFYILKPIDLKKGAHKLMYEPPNRGGKTWNTFGRVPGGNDPGGTIVDPATLANAFLMPRGYTMVWSGWDKAAGTNTTKTALSPTTITLPIARNPDGSTITGPSYEYIVTSGTGAFTLTYPAANGIGFAAVRDWNAWLRYETRDDFGTPNPLAGDIQRIYTEVVSQPGRLLNDFRHLGFNQAENGKKVFDGLMQWIAAGDGINMNYRFSQPGRTERNRQDHLYVEGVFPFANVMTHDPITGKTDSRYARCMETHTCPFGVEIYSANEYWVKAASLLHTNP